MGTTASRFASGGFLIPLFGSSAGVRYFKPSQNEKRHTLSARRKPTILTTLTALGAVTALALTGCSGGSTPAGNGAPKADNGSPSGSNASDALWDFSNNDAMSQKQSITFAINDDLFAVATDYAGNRVFDSITVTGLEVSDAKYCAVKIEFDYADGVDMDALIGAYIAGYKSLNLERLDAASSLIGFGGLRADKEFGEADLKNLTTDKLWISDDYSTATKIQDCATQPYDPDAFTVPVEFAWAAGTEGGNGTYLMPTLARAALTVMKNGDLTVIDNDVSDFVRDSNGTWIAK